MKAITLWQPWASLLACGAKQYETRSWATKYRGPIAIHAAVLNTDKIVFGIPDCRFIEATYKALGVEELGSLPHGYIIATAELVDCVRTYKRGYPAEYAEQIWLDYSRGDGWRDDRQVCGNELLFGDFTPGRYAWEFANMTMLAEPIHAKGKQGLWNWEGAA